MSQISNKSKKITKTTLMLEVLQQDKIYQNIKKFTTYSF